MSDTNINPHFRKLLVQRLFSLGYSPITAYVFNVSGETCFHRNETRTKPGELCQLPLAKSKGCTHPLLSAFMIINKIRSSLECVYFWLHLCLSLVPVPVLKRMEQSLLDDPPQLGKDYSPSISTKLFSMQLTIFYQSLGNQVPQTKDTLMM